eukprot:Hpha_TRINITY_DN16281_c4_g5::TRINITY_DN16281_c4_g5_i1::g.14882::m.14882
MKKHASPLDAYPPSRPATTNMSRSHDVAPPPPPMEKGRLTPITPPRLPPSRGNGDGWVVFASHPISAIVVFFFSLCCSPPFFLLRPCPLPIFLCSLSFSMLLPPLPPLP